MSRQELLSAERGQHLNKLSPHTESHPIIIKHRLHVCLVLPLGPQRVHGHLQGVELYGAGVDAVAPLAAARHLGAVCAAAGCARSEHVHLGEPAQRHRQLGHHHHAEAGPHPRGVDVEPASVLDTWV